MLKPIKYTLIFLILIYSNLNAYEYNTCLEQAKQISTSPSILTFKPYEMVVMSMEEWLANEIDLPQVKEALSNYHQLKPYSQDPKEFYTQPNKYFDLRLEALQNLLNSIPPHYPSLKVNKLFCQTRNKIKYISALPNLLDPRCSFKEETEYYSKKNLIIRDSYWPEFLDPLHRSGPEMSLYKYLWKVSDIPNFFIYLDTIEHSPLLEKYAPQTHQVLYFIKEERDAHKLHFKKGVAYCGSRELDTSEYHTNSAGKGFGIYILGTDGEFYVNTYSRYYLQHSSEFAGQEIIAAGEIMAKKGKILVINNKSGHYNPNLESILATLQAFQDKLGSIRGMVVNAILAKGATSIQVRATYDALELLSNKGDTLPFAAQYNWTPLHIAVWRNQFSLAKEAVSNCYIDTQNDKGMTAFHLAVQGGYDKWIAFLLKHGASCNIPSYNGYTPFHLAALKGDVDTIELLYEHSDKSLRSNTGETALLLAIKSGNIKAMKSVLKNEIQSDVDNSSFYNDYDNQGNGHLYYAVSSNQIEMLKYHLHSHNPDALHDLNFAGENLLHAAASYASPNIFKLLFNLGVDPTHVDHQKNNLLHQAVKHNNNLMVEYLLQRGFTWMLQQQNIQGATPLHYAAETLSSDAFEKIIPFADCIDMQDIEGNTPLVYAIKAGSLRNLLNLLKNGADMHHFNAAGQAPIHISAATPEFSLNAMLCHQDDLMLLDVNKNIPLHIALINQNTQAANYLIPYYTKETLLQKNSNGENALSLAKKLKDRSIINELRKIISNSE